MTVDFIEVLMKWEAHLTLTDISHVLKASAPKSPIEGCMKAIVMIQAMNKDVTGDAQPING